MPEFHPENEECVVSVASEAAERLRFIAEPRPIGDNVKAAINRASARVSRYWPLSPSRAEDIWRKEARVIRAEEMDAIRRACAEREASEAKAREHARSVGTIFAGVAERLRASSDPEFHREDIAALVDAARLLGALDRPVAETEGE